jgi:hypothetical protein
MSDAQGRELPRERARHPVVVVAAERIQSARQVKQIMMVSMQYWSLL